MTKNLPTWVMVMAGLASSAAALAQDAAAPSGKKITYSPYPAKSFPNRVYFGDTHLHTSYSTDAGIMGNTLGPEEAYRFARGELVRSSTVVADHSENLGLAPAIAKSNAELVKNPWGKMVTDLVKKGDIASVTKAYEAWQVALNKRDDPLKEQTALAQGNSHVDPGTHIQHAHLVWAEPFVTLRVPKIFNLRTDPYERADITSNTYWDWILDHIYLLVPAQAKVGEFLATFKKFPPRQKAASFGVDQVMDKLTAGLSSK